MENNFDWKKIEFITTVQTGLINNGINRSLDDDPIKNRAEFSPATVLYHIGDHDPSAKMPEWFGPPTVRLPKSPDTIHLLTHCKDWSGVVRFSFAGVA